MKKYLLSSILAVASFTLAHAQIHVGSFEVAVGPKAGKLSDSYIEELKNTTTLFVLQNRDFDNLSEWENVIKSVWTITPFKIIRSSELSRYSGKQYSYFTFGGFVKTRENEHKIVTHTEVHLSYDLWKNNYNKKGEPKKIPDYYSRILIYPDNDIMFTAAKAKDSKDLTAKMNAVIYKSGSIYNWSPYMLKGYLKVVNQRLSDANERSPFSTEDSDPGLKALQTDTLYIPDYVKLKFGAFTGREHVDEEGDDEIKDAYPYPVRIVTEAELSQIISQRNKPVYYLVFVKSSADKYISVYEARSGRMLYSRHTGGSYNFKNKDLGKLAKSIR